MATRTKKILYIIIMAMLLLVTAACVYLYVDNARKTEMIADFAAKQDENDYFEIYDSESIDELMEENEKLYKEIEEMKNVKDAVSIEYRYIIKSDTVYAPIIDNMKDTVYHYAFDNDTIKYNLDISAARLRWHSLNFEINDNFTIIGSEIDNGTNSIIIKHSENVDIVDVDAWKKKATFKEHIFYGPSIGAGYGMLNNNFDIYVGFSAGYKF